MDILGQSALIVSGTAFSIAVTSLSRNLKNKLVMSYALLCGVLCLWSLFFFLEKVVGTGTFYRLHLDFSLALAPVGLFFIRILTRVNTPFSQWWYRLSILYGFAVAILSWTSWGAKPVVRNIAFFAPGFLVIECFHLMAREWAFKKGMIKNVKVSTVGFVRRTWIFVGALVIMATAVMDHVPLLGDVIPSIGNILLCMYLFFISEAIIQQRLLNLNALVKKVLMLVMIGVAFTAIIVFLVGWIERSPALFLLNSFVASFIILMVVDPLRKLANMALTRFLSRENLKIEKCVSQAQKQLTGILDSIGLSNLTLDFLDNILHYESATFFVLRLDGSKFRRIRGVRDDQLSNREILANHALIDFFIRLRRRGETPVVLNHYLVNEIDRSMTTAQRQAYDQVLKGLQGLNANIAIPFMTGGVSNPTVLGFVVIQAPLPPESWGNNWGVLSLLYPFFIQASRTLKNMEVYKRMREQERLAALGEMSAGLAHEIRNPLGAIKGAAQCLEDEYRELRSPFLKVIIEEVNRLNVVVSQFLDYSRPSSLEYQSLDPGYLLERTHALFKTIGIGDESSSQIQIDLAIPADGLSSLPSIACAPEQIKQVLVNLVQNSIHSLSECPPEGGGKIRIGAKAQKRSVDETSEVIFFVEDNGQGISREMLDKIFIPFYSSSKKGTGLGLSICSRIVESHGGRIDVMSEEGRLTQFLVHLPVHGVGAGIGSEQLGQSKSAQAKLNREVLQ